MSECPFRLLCEAMRMVSCRPAARETMAGAIRDCKAAECFRLFGQRQATP